LTILNQQYPASGVIKHLIAESKYKEFLLDGTPEGEARFENVQELVSVASKYDALEPGISLATFLEEVALITDLDQVDDRTNAVTLMTLHSAKGLEFPYVFLCGLEEGIFPHSRSLFEPQQLEEERRLMYVGLTRAMERVYLSYAENRLLYGTVKSNAPSQFLEDIPEELIEREGSTLKKVLEQNDGILSMYQSGGLKRVPRESEFGFYPDAEPEYKEVSQEIGGFGLEESALDSGDRVQHKMYGEGVVVGLKGGIATIAFKNRAVGVKKLALSVAPLKKL
ncbi:MAG: 3'-5' exonuclease, partial [Candidatus Gracilibacteria bacterium]